MLSQVTTLEARKDRYGHPAHSRSCSSFRCWCRLKEAREEPQGAADAQASSSISHDLYLLLHRSTAAPSQQHR